jgi:uncharacterized protein (TIGR00730 family)
MPLHRVCVFCGSSPGARPEYADAAGAVGRLLAGSGITLVYGGASVGLMGVLADATLQAGGRVIGVIPRALVNQEIAHTGLTELRVVESMHERKAEMADLSDGFLALPGGLGTLEELFEIWTWGNLGYHQKPCGLLNTSEYYTSLLKFVDDMVVEKFVRETQRGMLIVDRDADTLLRAMAEFKPPETRRLQPRDDL